MDTNKLTFLSSENEKLIRELVTIVRPYEVDRGYLFCKIAEEAGEVEEALITKIDLEEEVMDLLMFSTRLMGLYGVDNVIGSLQPKYDLPLICYTGNLMSLYTSLKFPKFKNFPKKFGATPKDVVQNECYHMFYKLDRMLSTVSRDPTWDDKLKKAILYKGKRMLNYFKIKVESSSLWAD